MPEAIVVTAEFRLKPGHVDEWLQMMVDHYGPACVEEQGMLAYWLQRDDEDDAHILLYEQWADRVDFEASLRAPWRESYHADTERLWDEPRVMTIYRRIPTPWEPLDDDGLPRMFRN